MPITPRPRAGLEEPWLALHAAADDLEPKLAAAFVRAAGNLLDDVTLSRIESAVEIGGPDAVAAIFSDEVFERALAEVAEVVRMATLDGFDVGSEMLEEYLS